MISKNRDHVDHGRNAGVQCLSADIHVVAEEAEASALEGERKTVTALFSDINSDDLCLSKSDQAS